MPGACDASTYVTSWQWN